MQDIQAELEKAQSARQSRIPIVPGRPVAWGIAVAHEALQWRLVSIADSCATALRQGEWIAACILARSAMETVAAIYMVDAEADAYIQGRDYSDVKARVKRLWLGRKDKPEDQPINVLTCIQKMAKQHTQAIEDTFAHLCEIAHPNYFGTHGFFGRQAGEDQYEFNDHGRDESGYYQGIAEGGLSAALAFGNLYRDGMAATVVAQLRQPCQM